MGVVIIRALLSLGASEDSAAKRSDCKISVAGPWLHFCAWKGDARCVPRNSGQEQPTMLELRVKDERRRGVSKKVPFTEAIAMPGIYP